MKIGIFAGTFDPIHNGHIAFANTAITQAQLEKVILVAEKNPYRKKPYSSWDHRQAMIERAAESVDQIDHDYQFANQLAHQHTMKDMIAVARTHYGKEHEFWFLVGSDIFEHMGGWQDILKNHEYGGFVVALRDDHTQQWLDERIAELSKGALVVKVLVVENAHPETSSSGVRSAIESGQQSLDISDAVYTYIQAHHLYADS